MKKITVRVPVRADLAGGTLDLWPLYLFHHGACTVNTAISLHAECEISGVEGTGVEVHLTDNDYHKVYTSILQLSNDPAVGLISKAVEHFQTTGIRIVTRTEVPRGSGLGGSSALSVALVRALSQYVGHPVEGDELIALVRDLETRLLGSPAGVQDYYPPVYGGLASLHLNPGRITRHPLGVPASQLAEHFVLHYTGIAHFSGTNNWEVYKRHIDGDEKIQNGLKQIAAVAGTMEKALEARDFEAAGKALAAEWALRKALIEGISNPEIDHAIELAAAAGSWGGKVCGAGGGGCIIFLCPADKRQAVIEALGGAAGRVLDVHPVTPGLHCEEAEEPQASFSFTSRRSRLRQTEESLDQLYLVTSAEGPYRAFILAEGIVTYDEPRAGIHHTVSRALVAPVDIASSQIDWAGGFTVAAPDDLRLTAVPDPRRTFARGELDDVIAAAHDGEKSLREFLLESDRPTIFHNPAFGIFSAPGESRDDFIRRCREQAVRRSDSEKERLESTFRRRIDQMREKSDRETRENEEQAPTSEIRAGEVSIAWGQTLYNMTSGRPSSEEAPQSVSEADYRLRIAEIQKAWNRELETIREDLDGKARSVEEFPLVASRNVEIRKYVILWAPTFDADDVSKRPAP